MQNEVDHEGALPDFQDNDHWLARLFYHTFEGKIYYTSSRGWMIFDGKRFTDDPGGTIVGKMGEFLEFESYRSIERNDDKAVQRYLNLAQSDKKIKSALNLSKYYFFDDGNNWDADPTLFNCNNGTINLATGKLQPHDWRDKITRVSPIDYLGENAPRENVEKFLNELFKDPEMISMIRRFIGYCLTGLTNEDAIFFLYGTGLNGKSTLCNLLVETMGDYAVVARIETFLTAHRGASNHSGDLARLAGARFVVAGEPGPRTKIDESIIKSMCGGDKVTARFAYGREFTFDQTFKIALYFNNAPEIEGADDGTWRRIYPITFPNKFTRNDTFKLALKKELSGFLYLAVIGAKEWLNSRLGTPPQVTEDADNYRRISDPFGTFIEEECDINDEYMDSSSTLFGCYDQWAKKNNEEDMSHKQFAMTLKERGFQIKHRREGNYFFGISKKSASYLQKCD